MAITAGIAHSDATGRGDADNGGFSSAASEDLVAQPIADGRFGYPEVNVESQRSDPGSLMSLTQRMAQMRLGMREMIGDCRPARIDCAPVFGLRFDEIDGEGSTVLAFTNLCGEAVEFEVREDDLESMVDVLADTGYPVPSGTPLRVRLGPYGYRWLRRKGRALDPGEATRTHPFQSAR